MLFLVLGLPGPFSERCERLTLDLVERAYGVANVIRADTLEELAFNLLHNEAPGSVLVSFTANGGIWSAVAEADKPFIVALDDPQIALAHLVTRREMDIVAATRLVASACASTIAFRATPGALVLNADPNGVDWLSLTAAIAQHLRLDVGREQLVAVARLAEQDDGAGSMEDHARWWAALDPAERMIASGAIDAFVDHFAGSEWRPITWSPELFFVGDQSTERAVGAVDITGRARCLLRGPDILLPPGSWSISLALDFSPQAAEHDFFVEVTGEGGATRSSIQPDEDGIVDVEATVEFEMLPRQPLNLRLWSERAAFDGTVTLRHVNLTRQEPAASALAPQ